MCNSKFLHINYQQWCITLRSPASHSMERQTFQCYVRLYSGGTVEGRQIFRYSGEREMGRHNFSGTVVEQWGRQFFTYDGGTVERSHNFSGTLVEQWREDNFSCTVTEH